MVLNITAHMPRNYAVVGLAKSLNVLIVQNILSALRTDMLKSLAVTFNAIEAVLVYNVRKKKIYISHTAIFSAKRLSALAAVKATAVVVLSTHFDNLTTKLRVA